MSEYFDLKNVLDDPHDNNPTVIDRKIGILRDLANGASTQMRVANRLW